MPIMLRGWGGDVTYAEGFAGPGVYDKGEAGSPVIALRSLLDDLTLKRYVKHVRFLFVDADQRCADMLEGKLVEAASGIDFARLRTFGIDIAVRRGRCEPVLEQLLTEKGAWGQPILMVLDTFGGAVSESLLRRVASNKGSEVIVTIQPQYFSRFAEVTEVAHGDRVFGSSDWRAVAAQTAEKKAAWLLNRYRQTVKDAGFSHVLDFELVDARGHSLYLVYGTSHRRGLEKMKEAMWEVDGLRGLGYRDPRDPEQQTLEIELEPQTAPLRRLLLDFLSRQPDKKARLHDLREFTLFETVYKPGQVRADVRDMVSRGLLRRDDRPGDVHDGTHVWLP